MGRHDGHRVCLVKSQNLFAGRAGDATKIVSCSALYRRNTLSEGSV